MANGIYLIHYTGLHGMGSASLVFLNGQIFGTDGAGSEYTGSYQSENGNITGSINLHVPAGVPLVTGAPVSPQPYTVPIPFSLPDNIAEQQTVLIGVRLPTGPVNANVKKVKAIAV